MIDAKLKWKIIKLIYNYERLKRKCNPEKKYINRKCWRINRIRSQKLLNKRFGEKLRRLQLIRKMAKEMNIPIGKIIAAKPGEVIPVKKLKPDKKVWFIKKSS